MIPSRLVGGRYLVLDALGSGVLGPIWRAQDRLTGQLVVIKELHLPGRPGAAALARFRDRLLREARLIGALGDPGLVGVHDVLHDPGDDVGVELLVTEFVGGETLGAHVASGGRLSNDSGEEVARSLLGTLQRAHRRGLVHGLVRPGSIVLGEAGRVALTDVGLARAAEPLLDGRLLAPEFAAPERAAGGEPTPSADLWALGAVLRRMVAADPPLDDLLAALSADDPAARPDAERALRRLTTEPPPRRGWFRK